MDTFFYWRVDVKSVRSNGFSLENLEPEKLSVSFSALRLGSIAAFGGVVSQGPLDQLNNMVIQSLGALYKVKNFSFVRLRSGSLMCHGDVVFQQPAPASADVLQTLVLSVGPHDMLAGSGFQVDPYSFTVADDQLEPPSVYPSFPGYAVAITVMCGLVIIAIPIVALLYLNSGLFGWHDKAIIQGRRDHEAGTQTFELDNQGFSSTIEEAS
ncbi:uncharacterized protein LOC127058564 [Gopherus flavomarginatus]|uniref:uncharacterized protein LOC127058564 n=1 Tax=Gopherus flavomarginatus TaxID=286002 RepID=UPI0021CBE436|nr:uncharacterized protein LOC127058564 [Gopherus flavomarginatus]